MGGQRFTVGVLVAALLASCGKSEDSCACERVTKQLIDIGEPELLREIAAGEVGSLAGCSADAQRSCLVPLLRTFIEEGDPEYATLAARAAFARGWHELRPDIHGMLDREDVRVRGAAIELHATQHPGEVVKRLPQLAASFSNLEYRYLIRRALLAFIIHHKPSEAIPHLIRFILEDDGTRSFEQWDLTSASYEPLRFEDGLVALQAVDATRKAMQEHPAKAEVFARALARMDAR